MGLSLGQGLNYASMTLIPRPGGGAAAVPWTPAQLGASVVGWHDAQDAATITLNAGNIASWANKASIGGAATQPTAVNQPAYSATGFDGSLPAYVGAASRYLNLPAAEFPAGSAPRYIFMVAGSTNAAGQTYLIGAPSNGLNGGLAIGFNLVNKTIYVDRSSSGISGTASWAAQTIVGFGYAGGIAGGYSLHRNGVPVGAGTTTVNNLSGVNGLGRWPEFGSAWIGPIGEVVIANRNLTAEERQRLEGYAAWRWNRVADLPPDHPYKAEPPDV